MKRIACMAALLVVTLPTQALSANIGVDSTMILRFEERAVTGHAKQQLLPATQFLAIDSAGLADGNLSMHLAGWARVDLADKSYSNDSVDGSLTYGYLRYRFTRANADIRAGRLFVREGIINEQLDGANARTDLPFGFFLSAFGGAPVHTKDLYGESSDGKGNSIFGGRLAYRYKGLLELGASGVYEGSAPTLTSHTNSSHRLVGGDIWLTPFRYIELIGHSSYNPETKEIAEHSYLLNLKPFNHLVITGEFNEYRVLSYLGATWSRFPGVALAPDEKTRVIGGSASYEISPAIGVSADYKHYKRDIGTADRFGGDIRLNFLNKTLHGGVGYHYLQAGDGFGIGYRSDGITKKSGSYNELRAYAMHNDKSHFAAIDAIAYIFKEKIDGEGSAWETKASLGYYLTPALAISGDISYGRNPELLDELKGLIRLTYNTTFDTKGGKK